MALPSDYPDQPCSLARSLEVVGQRWTLLIIRDAFYGVQRSDDSASHLRIPRAVLSERLKFLTDTGLLERVKGSTGRGEYRLSDKGTALWPAVRALLAWGDEYYAPEGPCACFSTPPTKRRWTNWAGAPRAVRRPRLAKHWSRRVRGFLRRPPMTTS